MLTPELIKKIRQIEINTRHLVQDSFAGEYQSVFKGQGMEFDEVRPYTAGDEIRTIDWNVTARMGTPFVRRYHEERELTVMLLVDASASSNFGTVGRFKRELATELAAVLAFAATTNNDKVGMIIFTDQIELVIPPRKGRRQSMRLIRDMLAFEAKGRGTDLKLALDTLNLIVKRHSVVFLVSDFLADPETYRRPLAVASRQHDVAAIDLHDPMEQDIAQVGLLALEDAESGQVTWVDTSSKAWQAAFQERQREFEAAKTQLFTALDIDHVSVTTDKDYMAGLTDFFRKRSRRQAR
jgi:uncharacterized protein (DUF58 family)